jgi:hypothetical protein
MNVSFLRRSLSSVAAPVDAGIPEGVLALLVLVLILVTSLHLGVHAT